MKQTTNEIDGFRDQIKSLKSTVFQLQEKVLIMTTSTSIDSINIILPKASIKTIN